MRPTSQASRIPATSAVWLVLLSGVACLLPIPSAMRMCLVALAMYLLIKSHLLVLDRASGNTRNFANTLIWFVGWPGLDLRFFEQTTRLPVRSTEWFGALSKCLIGALLFFALAPPMLAQSKLLACWLAMVGFVLILHCGLIHALALVFRANGRPVQPIMRRPLLATTVAEFWGKRWNLAFRDYAHRTIFGPLSKRMGPRSALVLGFLFSGLLHDVAISLPAHGGYGLPTTYFVLQSLAIILERQLVKRQCWKLSRTWLGRLWCFAWIALPAPWLLFHQPFLTRVVQPIVEFVALQPYGVTHA